MPTSISQHEFRWDLPGNPEADQFVGGDYYVVDSGAGVVVNSPHDLPPVAGMHGAMINPVTGAQAYDSGVSQYNPALAVTFPIALHAGESLVCAISLTDEDLNGSGSYTPGWYSGTIGAGHARIKSAAVLTCLAEHPPAGSFRPAHCGTNKPIYNISQINPEALPDLPAPASLPDIAYLERGMERVWLTHVLDFGARELHPLLNMRNYHREIGHYLSIASLLLLTNARTDTLLHRFIQTGIDHYAMLTTGTKKGDSASFEWQAIYTGILLGNEAMANVWKTPGATLTLGRAGDKFYYWDERGAGYIPSTIITAGQVWTGYQPPVFFRKQHGATEHEHLHPSEWEMVANGGGRKQESYRMCCDVQPHLGMALASKILGASSRWHSNALRDYLTRWMEEPFAAEFLPEIAAAGYSITPTTQSMGDAFRNAMYNTYKDRDINLILPPVFAPPDGSELEAGNAMVTLETSPGATIRYTTTTGEDPAEASAEYTGSIPAADGVTIKARGYQSGKDPSAITGATYTVLPPGVPAAPRNPRVTF